MTIYALNRLTISLKRFVEVEMPECHLAYYGNNKYSGNCQLPNHKEVDGQSFLIDERSGRATCMGKCNLRGADINQIAATLWNCLKKEAAQRLQAEAAKYGPRQLTVRNKGEKEEVPDLELATLATAIPEGRDFHTGIAIVPPNAL